MPSLLRYYVTSLRRVLHGPRQIVALAIASAMHAAGHALVALLGGALALALAARWAFPAGGVATSRAVLPRLLERWIHASAVDPSAAAKLAEQQAFVLSVAGLAVLTVKAAAGMYATRVQAHIAGQVGGRLRLELFDALLARHRLRHPRQDDHGDQVVPAARAVVALTERVRDVEAGLARGLLGGARALAQLLPIALVLVWLSTRMAAVALAALAVFSVVLGRWRAGYRKATRRAAREHERLIQAADDSVRHADLWVTFGAEARARADLQRLGAAAADRWAALEAREVGLSGANEVLGALALVVAVGASAAIGMGDGGMLLAFAVAFFLAYRPLRELADARAAFTRAEGACEDLRQVVDFSPAHGRGAETGAAPEATRGTWPLAALAVEGLRLRHGVSRPLSLRIPPGAIAVITGPTGIGKTTLLRTLLGLEPALAGDVVYAGISLAGASAGPHARPFAWVPQDAPLLADTLAANVALGAPLASAREALDAIGAAFLEQALDGHRLGAGGRAVSGGERQWISLARALATRQPVLLLDEPTSGLDPVSQRAVLDAIARLRGERTVIFVTHRREPLALADVVLRMDAEPAPWISRLEEREPPGPLLP